MTRTSMRVDLHAFMSKPGFAAENDGYALPSQVARDFKRSLTAVTQWLHEGATIGLFATRPHPTLINPHTGQPAREFKAITEIRNHG